MLYSDHIQEYSGDLRFRPLYRKALYINMLSRKLAHYLQYDFSELQSDGSEHPSIYFTGDIIRQSDSLAPEILNAEKQPFQDDRLKYADSLARLTSSLQLACNRLERAENNGREFVQLLGKELKKFRKLQRKWMLVL